MAYSSEENAIVEGSNKETIRYIRAFTFDRSTHDNHQEVIPFFTRLLNTNVNGRTTVAPAQIVFCNSVNLDRGILIPFDETSLTKDIMTITSSRMPRQQDNLLRIVIDNLLLADSIHNGNIADKLTEYAIDSYVLALPRTQPKTRLHPQWSGPFRILGNHAGKYKLQDLNTNREKMYHVMQLKQFLYDATETDPTDIARRDNLEFYVENPQKVATPTFLVIWLGYDERHNTYKPWRHLMYNEKLHEFLRSKNSQKFIPRKFLIDTTNSTKKQSETKEESGN